MAKTQDSGEWWKKWVFGFVGALLGAVFQYGFDRMLAGETQIMEIRRETYVQFMDAYAKLDAIRDVGRTQESEQKEIAAATGKADSPAVEPALSSTADDQWELDVREATKRIAVYGSSEVVEALVSYWERYYPSPPCEPRKEFEANVAVFEKMRAELLPGDPVPRSEMLSLQFNCRIDNETTAN